MVESLHNSTVESSGVITGLTDSPLQGVLFQGGSESLVNVGHSSEPFLKHKQKYVFCARYSDFYSNFRNLARI